MLRIRISLGLSSSQPAKCCSFCWKFHPNQITYPSHLSLKPEAMRLVYLSNRVQLKSKLLSSNCQSKHAKEDFSVLESCFRWPIFRPWEYTVHRARDMWDQMYHRKKAIHYGQGRIFIGMLMIGRIEIEAGMSESQSRSDAPRFKIRWGR